MGKWFGKETVELPPELADLTPDQVVAKIKAADLATARVTELEPTAAENATLKARIAELEKPAPRREEQQREQQQPQNERTSFLVDEDRAFTERIAPVVSYAMDLGQQMASSNFRNGISDPVERRMFAKYGKEVDDIMKAEQNPATRANPAAWLAAWDIIKGRHVMDISKNPNDFFSEVATGDNRSGPPAGPDPNVLTDDDKRLAKKYGLSEDDWKAQKKEMVIHHG